MRFGRFATQKLESGLSDLLRGEPAHIAQDHLWPVVDEFVRDADAVNLGVGPFHRFHDRAAETAGQDVLFDGYELADFLQNTLIRVQPVVQI